MTWRETISRSAAYLGSKAVPDAQVAAELLAARLLGCGRGSLHPALDGEVRPAHLEAMRRALRRLQANEPLQYVLGEWDFRRLTLKCDRRALIPRPETEGLVQLVLDWLAASAPQRPLLVDVGTGTGAIILSIADEWRSDAVLVGSDASEDAIALARENAVRTGLEGRVSFVAMDGLDDFDEPQSVDAIISNPPYIESAECDALDPRIRDFEPRMALDGGPGGMDFYERYLADAMNLLKPGGRVFFEIGGTQGERIAAMMRDFGFSDVAVKKDLAGLDRYAVGMLT